MTKRLNILAQKNAGIESLVAVETWIAKSFDPKLLELVKVRVSQMNGCAHCLHMHRQDAFKQGETINTWSRLTIGFRLQHPADRKCAA